MTHNDSEVEALPERLRKLATGTVEWRVQDPVEKCYCLSFGRDSINPEREAREWLADYRSRNPNGIHAHYEVAEVRYFTRLERAALDAADALDAALSALAAGKQEAIPEGWRLVPVEPTEAMHVAAVKTAMRCTGNADFPPRVWRAMLAASPSPLCVDPESAGTGGQRKATDAEIQEWADRHDLRGSITELRCIFEDAESLHLTYSAAAPERREGDGGVARSDGVTASPAVVMGWLNPDTGKTCSADEKHSMEKHQGLPGITVAKGFRVPLVAAPGVGGRDAG